MTWVFTILETLCVQFPQNYAGINEANQPAELIPQFSTAEYRLKVTQPLSLSLDYYCRYIPA